MSTRTPTQTNPARKLVLRRAGAYVVDIVILFAVMFPLGWAVVLLGGFSPSSGVQIWEATLINFSIPAWTYFCLSDSVWGGQTLGKRMLKVRVIGPSGLPPRIGRALLRTAVKLLPWELAHIGGFALQGYPVIQWVSIGVSNLLILIYLAALIPTKGRRSIHDWVARTQVVREIKGDPNVVER